VINSVVLTTKTHSRPLSRPWGACFFHLGSAFLLLVISAWSLSVALFPATKLIDLTLVDSVSVSFKDPGFAFQFFPFLVILLALIASWAVPHMFLISVQRGSDKDGLSRDQARDWARHSFFDSLTFTPFFIYLPFILLPVCWLRVPLGLLLAWSLVAHILWRVWYFLRHSGKRFRAMDWSSVRARLEGVSSRTIWSCLVLVFLIVYAGLAVVYSSALIGLEGDEPEYVMVAHSLLTDGDIMVRDNYEQLEYRLFLRHKLPFGRTTYEGYPVEGLALSLYLVPFYWLVLQFPAFSLLILRLSVVPLAALLIAELFLLLESITRQRLLSLVVVLAGGLTSPLLFYAPLVFSEIIGALFLTCALRSIYLMKDRRSSGYAGIVWTMLLLWTGAKYVTFTVPLVIWQVVQLIGLWKSGQRPLKRQIIISVIVFMVMVGSYLIFLWTFYHSISPLATRGGELLEFTRKQGSGLSDTISWLTGDRLSRLPYSFRVAFGNFIDQRVGLLIYSPFYILLFSGIVSIIRNKSRDFYPFSIFAALYWFMLFWLSYWEGYGPPSRYTIPVIPVFLLFVLKAVMSSSTAFFFMVPLTSISVLWALIAVRTPELLYHHTLWRYGGEMNNFLTYYSGNRYALPLCFPSFTEFPFRWIPFVIVTTVIVLIVYCSRRQLSLVFRHFLLMNNVCWSVIPIIIMVVYLVDPMPLMTSEHLPGSMLSSPSCNVAKSVFGAYQWEGCGFWTRTRRWAAVQIETDSRHDYQLTFALHSLEDNEVSIRSGLGQVRLVLPRNKVKALTLRNVLSVPVNNRQLIFLQFTSARGRNPFYQDRADDGRELGVFVSLVKAGDHILGQNVSVVD